MLIKETNVLWILLSLRTRIPPATHTPNSTRVPLHLTPAEGGGAENGFITTDLVSGEAGSENRGGGRAETAGGGGGGGGGDGGVEGGGVDAAEEVSEVAVLALKQLFWVHLRYDVYLNMSGCSRRARFCAGVSRCVLN